jgi:hypothetical protein
MSVSGQMYHTDDFGITRIISDEEARASGLGDASPTDASIRKRSYVEELNPVSAVAPNGFRLAFDVVVMMLSSLSSPAVIWAILASSISLGETPHLLKHVQSFTVLTLSRCWNFDEFDLRAGSD